MSHYATMELYKYIPRSKAHADISWLLMAIANSVKRENPTDEVRR